MRIDFEDFRRRAESDPVSFMLAMQPGGTFDRHEREFYAASPGGGKGRSCKTALKPDKMFYGRDFADNGPSWSGPIDLAMAASGLANPREAVMWANERLGQPVDKILPSERETPAATPRADQLKPLLSPEGSLPGMKIGGRDPVLVSHYRDPWCNWALVFIIARYEPKTFIPFTYGELDGVIGWHKKMRPGPRPVLGLMELRRHLDAKKPLLPGLVVEGEKAYEAARRMVSDRYHIFTWHGGANAVDKTDWRLLDGLPGIYLWPDNDEPGRKAMQRVAEHLAHCSENKIYFVTPPDDVPEGWDAADAEVDGRDNIVVE